MTSISGTPMRAVAPSLSSMPSVPSAPQGPLSGASTRATRNTKTTSPSRHGPAAGLRSMRYPAPPPLLLEAPVGTSSSSSPYVSMSSAQTTSRPSSSRRNVGGGGMPSRRARSMTSGATVNESLKTSSTMPGMPSYSRYTTLRSIGASRCPRSMARMKRRNAAISRATSSFSRTVPSRPASRSATAATATTAAATIMEKNTHSIAGRAAVFCVFAFIFETKSFGATAKMSTARKSEWRTLIADVADATPIKASGVVRSVVASSTMSASVAASAPRGPPSGAAPQGPLSGAAAQGRLSGAVAQGDEPFEQSDMEVYDGLVALRSGWYRSNDGSGDRMASGAEYLAQQTAAASRAMAAFAQRTRGRTVLRPFRFVVVYDKGALPNKGATQRKRSGRFKSVDEARQALREAEARRAAAAPAAAAARALDLDGDDAPEAGPRGADAPTGDVARAQQALREAVADDEHQRRVATDPSVLERLELQPALPETMERVIGDRRVRRPLLVSAVSRALLSHGQRHTTLLQRNCTLVVDGHCMSRQQARDAFGDAFLDSAPPAPAAGSGAGLSGDALREGPFGDGGPAAAAAAAAPSDDEHRAVPLMSFLDDSGRHRVTFAYALANDVTEADLAVFWHVAASQPRAADTPWRCVLRTVDTDFLPLSMLFIASQRAPSVELYVALPKVRRGAPPETLYFHANAMCAAVREYAPLHTDRNAVLSFVAVLLASGSDYTPTLRGVPPKHFLTALAATRPQNLVRDGLVVDYYDFRMLLTAAYHSANARFIRNEPSVAQRAVGAVGYEDIARASARRPVDQRMPSEDDVRRRAQMVQEILRIWAQAGERHTLLPLPEPLDDDGDDDEDAETAATSAAPAVGTKRSANSASSSSSSSSMIRIIDDTDDDGDDMADVQASPTKRASSPAIAKQ